MDNWIYNKIWAKQYLQIAVYFAILLGIVAFVFYKRAFFEKGLNGPLALSQQELDKIEDVWAYPDLVKVNGSQAMESSVKKFRIQEQYGRETSRSVSASYYVLTIGNRKLVVEAPEISNKPIEKLLHPTGTLRKLRRRLQDEIIKSSLTCIRNFSTCSNISTTSIDVSKNYYPFYLQSVGYSFGPVVYFTSGICSVIFLIFMRPLIRSIGYCRNIASHPLVLKLSKWGNPSVIAQEIQTQMQSAQLKSRDWTVTNDYLIRKTMFCLDIYRISELLWAYKRVTKHEVRASIYFIPILFVPAGNTHAVILRCYGGNIIIQGRKVFSENLLQYLATRVPWAAFGYSRELERNFSKRTKEFCAAVEQRKRDWANKSANSF